MTVSQIIKIKFISMKIQINIYLKIIGMKMKILILTTKYPVPLGYWIRTHQIWTWRTDTANKYLTFNNTTYTSSGGSGQANFHESDTEVQYEGTIPADVYYRRNKLMLISPVLQQFLFEQPTRDAYSHCLPNHILPYRLEKNCRITKKPSTHLRFQFIG